MRSSIFTLALTILCLNAFAQTSFEEYVGEYITVEDGLSDRTVWDIIQDSKGFVWIATQNGLNRYDGYEFLTFDANARSAYSLSGDDIRHIEENRNRQLVIQYFDEWHSIDLLDITSHQVHRIALNASRGLKGELLDFYTPPKGDSYALCRTKDSTALTIFKLGEDRRFHQLLSIPTQLTSDDYYLRYNANDEFWIASATGYFLKLNTGGDVLQRLEVSNFEQPPATDNLRISILHTDTNGRLWVAFKDHPGIYVYNSALQSFQQTPLLPADIDFNLVFEDENGNLLFADLDRSLRSRHLWLLQADNISNDVSQLLRWENRITSAYGQDFTKLLFFGSHVGITKLIARPNQVQTYLAHQLGANEWGPSFRGITGDGKNNVYFAREVKAWYHLNTSTNVLDTLQPLDPITGEPLELRLASDLILGNDSTLWGTAKVNNVSLLLRLDLQTQQWTKFSIPGSPYIVSFSRGADGNFYLAARDDAQHNQLLIFNAQTGNFESYRNANGTNPLEGHRPRHIITDHRGRLLIGTNQGLLRINTEQRSSEKYVLTDLADWANDNDIWAVHESSSGIIWLGTYGDGLVRLNTQNGELKIYDRSHGICNEKVCGIIEDEDNNLWISTFNGLSFLDTETEQFRNFYTRDGLSYSEFNRLSFYQDAGGRLYFGGLNGVNAFYADNLLQKQDSRGDRLQLTKVTSFDDNTQDLITRTHNLSTIKRLVLPAKNRSCIFSFALTNFVSPENNQFAYMIEELDDDWNYLGNTNEIHLNYLPPGSYNLRVKAADHTGYWTEYPQTIELKAENFFYNTWWFYLLLLLLLGGSGFLVLRSTYRTRLEQQEARRLKEIDEVKDRLYANITHEFRTPLTLILGPARQIQQQLNDSDAILQKNVSIILQNGQRLLQLVNQMLDLGKLEAKKMQPEYLQDNIVPFLSYITDSFQSLAASQNIDMTFKSSHDTIVMDFDQDKLMKIVSNLLSNALKFTEKGGQINVLVKRNKQELHISVKDNGTGISQEKLPYIFDRFYQADHSDIRKNEGTGIGLAFTKESVKLLDGDISVESIEGIGSRFTVVLPIRQEAPLAKSAPLLEKISSPTDFHRLDTQKVTQRKDLPLLLIIEDNADVAQFIASSLCPTGKPATYQILFAKDGEMGLEKATTHIPDLIISDVMMPKRDGFELCQLLKNDERTSHIPIILLTARTAIEDRLKGLEQGANAYLEKPFHETEIRLQVENMLGLRNELKQRYTAPDIPAQQTDSEMHQSDSVPNFNLQMEDAFVQKVLGIIDQHIGDAQFSVVKLAKAVNLSKSQLNRKLSAVTDFSPTQLIRYVRLKKAKELLEQKDINISDVAYQTGFSDPSYFTRIFTKEFDITPSDYKRDTIT